MGYNLTAYSIQKTKDLVDAGDIEAIRAHMEEYDLVIENGAIKQRNHGEHKALAELKNARQLAKKILLKHN